MTPATLHLVLGGARSGKSARALRMAEAAHARGAAVTFIATAWAADDEMRARIAQHRTERPSGWTTVELGDEPGALAAALQRHAHAGTCVLVDCLTLWLSQLACPPPDRAARDIAQESAALFAALEAAQGEVVLVSNEIGLGVVPLGREARLVVDALGRLHQQIAARADSVTLMVAGLPLTLKGSP